MRNLLWHIKKSDYFLNNKPDEYSERDKECREQIYDAVKENIEYFTDYTHMFSNQSVYLEVSVSSLDWKGMTLDELYELKETFNKSATGLYGREYDNSTSLLLSDGHGNKFILSIYKHNTQFELSVWDMSGQRNLVSIKTKENKLDKEQIKLLNSCQKILLEKYEKEEQSKNRYKQIRECKDYIVVTDKKSGYAHYVCDVLIKRDIPIKLSEFEIAKYVDDWNYCFGGSIHKVGEDSEGTKYRVKVHTD